MEPSEEWEEVSNWLIPGIVCHTSERFWKYRLFGVEFKIPKGYKLFNRRLTLGRPVMIFKDGDKTLVLHWCYFAREYLSKYKNLLEWSKKEIPKEVYAAIRDLNYNKLRPEESGRLIVEEVVQSGLLGRRTIVKTVRIWHEPTFNKILLSGYAGPQENIVDLEELEKSISFEKIGE